MAKSVVPKRPIGKTPNLGEKKNVTLSPYATVRKAKTSPYGGPKKVDRPKARVTAPVLKDKAPYSDVVKNYKGKGPFGPKSFTPPKSRVLASKKGKR